MSPRRPTELARPPTSHTLLQPAAWPRPVGYANGILARGDMIFTGGLIGWDAEGHFADGLVEQARQALVNITVVLAEAGAAPEHLVRMTWYVVNMEAYRAVGPALGRAYRDVIGRHYPAMAVVEVTRLVEPQALVEIEATAVIPRP
ncbi:MAG TPA: RidA family protein [Xanthobacteraceae bacterium]|nr:RidA family protein [Xanthobacteraceae bacterium]